MNILVLNCGSSPLKFQIIATDLEMIARDGDRHLARGLIERIGGEAVLSSRAASVKIPPRYAHASAPTPRG